MFLNLLTGLAIAGALAASASIASGQEEADPQAAEEVVAETAQDVTIHPAGPSSVEAQIDANETARENPGPALPRVPLRQRLERQYGLVFGADYQALFQYASDTAGEDTAAGGVLRFYGSWAALKRDETRGSLVFKVEHRHELGTDIAPQALGPDAGFAGLTAVSFSDAGFVLTNLYWTQSFAGNRLALIVGTVDVTDYVDVYGLVNPWEEFNNLAFSTNPSIAAPNQGLGVAVRFSLTPHYYVLGGIADANGDPHDPGDSFDSFFSVGEHFRHIEIGWVGSWENRFSDNIHLTVWQVDDRDKAEIDDGWGLTVSFSKTVFDRWLPFLRAGYSDGGGALVDRSISAGVGYRLTDRKDYIGFGANWGSAPKDTIGDKNGDQFTFETYCRLQILPQVQVVPSVQLIVDPAYAPEKHVLWIPGVRVRATF